MTEAKPEDLPDPLRAAAEALTALGIHYAVHKDRELVVAGDIKLGKQNLTELPNLSCVTVFGDFQCHGNRLTSLKGAPLNVRGHFLCHHNRLRTLIGAPKHVGKSFMCHNNVLTSLEGAPEEIAGEFHCYDNRLKSLIGGPKRVTGSYSCTGSSLETLEGAPTEVGQKFFCNDNPLKHLEHAPEKFRQLQSDHGSFVALDQIPDNIRFSPETLERKATILERAMTIRRPLRLRL